MPKILLVDEDMSPTKLFTLAFRREGFDISVASSKDEALALASREPPDAVLVDLKLSGLSANNICISLRAALKRVNTPILVFSGVPYTAARAAAPGATAYLRKPINFLEVAASLSKVLEEQAAPAPV